MDLNWEQDGSGWLLTGSDAPYDRYRDAHARIRPTNAGEYFCELTGTDSDAEPTFYPSLEDCKRECKKAVMLDRVERKLAKARR
jgi:hypothetical protein